MDCAEARDHLSDLNRGGLTAEAAEAVRAHAQHCPRCAEALRVDAEVREVIRRGVPRYAAPPALRARVQTLLAESSATRSGRISSPGWGAWFPTRRWFVGSLAGAMAAVLVGWAGMLWLTADPVSRLADWAVEEHGEYKEATMHGPAADPQMVLRELKTHLGFPVGPVFLGDAEAELVAGKVGEFRGARAATLIYRDAATHYSTLFLLPEVGVRIPAEGRLRVESFAPYHRVVEGRQLLLWKQGPLTCVLVSDLDQPSGASMFLKIRKAM
jgi:anti-sigma factor (TIGR02949 family)